MDTAKIHETLRQLLLEKTPPLKVKQNSEKGLELAGTKEAMQGKQKVDGFYFASIVPKPKDVRLYFFPIYTDPQEFSLSPELRKMLKGKSCFHIKKLDENIIAEIKDMIEKGVKIYQDKDLI
jgi:hypothetical protein